MTNRFTVNADNNLLLFDVYKNTLQKVALINADGSSFEAGKEEPVFFWETSLQLPVLLCGGKAWLIEKKQSTVLTATLIGEDIPQNVFIKFAQYEKNGKNLFLGSASKGLYVVHQSQLSVIYPPQATPYERNAMYSQVELPNGNILIRWKNCGL